jgi:hypothetical protein
MNAQGPLLGLSSPFGRLLVAGGLGLVSCTGAEDEASVAASAQQRLGPAEDEAVRKTLAPIRSLQTPGGVYMTSIAATISATGSLSHVIHVYQPDATGEAIRFELAARTSTGVVDASHTFSSVALTSHPGESDETTQALPGSGGQRVYAIAASRPGWYRFSFIHTAPSAGRTLMIRAYDAADNALKMMWSDPPGANAQVRVRIAVTQASDVFFKGGAYRNTHPAQFAYGDNVKLNGTLLYRRGFDQGRYNFPLGRLAAGQHTLEFSLGASAGSTKYWFGVDEKSFDPNGVKTSWEPLQFLYYGAMRTGDYDAWSDGVAFAQGASVTPGVRPPPVRRGTTFSVAVEHPSLGSGDAMLRVYPLGSGSELTWSKTLPAAYDYRGALFVAGAPSVRQREHWRVAVPSNAPVGRYVLRALAPSGAQIGADVVFYVVHNPYTLLASGAISKPELETYAYDEDEDGVSIQAPFGADQDGFRDHFSAFYDGQLEFGYTPRTKITGAFRRTQGESSFSMLDIAVAAADGTTSEFQSMRRLYRIVSQRLRYNRPDIQDDSSITMLGTMNGLTPEQAFQYSKPGTELSGQWTAQCFDYGTVLTAVARSAGILARPVSSANWLGGWGNHVFTEVFIPTLPEHGGKRTSNNSSPDSDTDHWYTFDSTDPNGISGLPRQFTVYSEAIAPRAQYGKTALVLQGPPSRAVDAVTNPLTWEPLSFDTVDASGVATVSAAYGAGPEFWLTASGVTGWLGYGEKDVYRIGKESTGAKAVRVRTLPTGGEYLAPKLCVGSVANVPIMPDPCSNPSTWHALPRGESYVVVFSDAEDVPARYLRGDSVQYVLELEY